MRAGQSPGSAYFRALGSNPYSVNSLLFPCLSFLVCKMRQKCPFSRFGGRQKEIVIVKGAEHSLFYLQLSSCSFSE